MKNTRLVYKQLSIFDIFNYISGEIPDKKGIRIMHEYNGIDKTEAFTVLNGDIPRETADSIISWLEENVSTEDLIHGLDSNDIDFRVPGKTVNERFLDA